MESPVYNNQFNVMKTQVYNQRIRIEADLDNMLNYPLPGKIYDMLDSLCGVKKPVDVDTVKIVMPGVGDTGTTLDNTPNLQLAADVSAALTAIEGILNNLITGAGFGAANNAFIITDAMRLAYPTKTLSPKGVSVQAWEYDVVKFQCSGVIGAHAFPVSANDQDGFGLLGDPNHTYPPQYATPMLGLLDPSIHSYCSLTVVSMHNI